MKAAFLIEPGKIKIKDIPKPELQDNQVLIKTKSVGLCGSDMHYYQHGKIDDYIVEKPIILGHEPSGLVKEVGGDVNNLSRGDRVTIEPGVPCGECNFCRQGNYNLCTDMVFMATPPIHGAFQEYIAYNANYVYKLPEEVSYEEGALVEPLAIGLNIYEKSDFTIGDKILILGAGTVGQMALQVFKNAGANEIVLTDIYDLPLEIAKNSGADRILKSNNINKLQDSYFDIVIDAVGVQETLQQTSYFVRPGGNIVLVGMSPNSMIEYEIGKVLNKELTLRGIFRYANQYSRGINLIADKKVELDHLITNRFSFNEIKKAFMHLSNNPNEYLKAIINFED